MAASAVFLQDLAVVTIVAALTSLVFQRLKFPLVFGLLAAGVIIGPHTPPFSLVRDEANLQALADLGVVLILFGLGLDFNLRTLRRVGLAAAVVMTIEVLLMLWLGFELGLLLGWSRLDAVYLGAMLSVSSTAIIVSVLRELGRLDAESSRVVFAVLVLEDIAAVLILVLLGGYAATGALPLQQATLVAGRMAVFLLGGLALGLLVVPRALDLLAKRFRPEVTVLAILGLALGAAVLSDAAGFHVGLGAFLAGALASEAKQRTTLEDRFRSVHDLFAAVFFVSIGTLVDFEILAAYWRPVVLISLVIVTGKLLSGALATFLAGYAPRTAIEVGASLAQIGEFSFVIAAVGLSTGTMSAFLFPIVVGCAAITSFASPLLIRHGPGLARTLGQGMPGPLRTYASVYSNWMRGLRTSQSKGTALARTARRRTILSALLVVLVLGGGLLGQGAVQPLLAAEIGTAGAALTYWGVVFVLLAPLTYELTREVGRWTDSVQGFPFARNTQGLGIRPVVKSTLYVLISIIVGLPVVVATAPFLAGPAAFLIWAVIVAAATALLARGVRRLHRGVHENVDALLREENLSVPVPEVIEAAVAKGLTGPLGTATVRLERDAWAAGRTIADTGLRTHTGASILLVHRDNSQHPAGPSTVLLPHDELILLGSPQQLEAAKAMLTRRAEPGQTRRIAPGQLYVPDGSPVQGKTLGESGVRARFGVQIVAIQRGPVVIANPGPDERLLAGDVLVTLGTEHALLEAESYLNSRLDPAAN